MDAAARSGSIPLVEHFLRNGHALGTSTMVSAVHAENSVEVVTWLLSKGCKGEEDVQVEAASNGNVAVLDLLSEEDEFLGFCQKVMTYAGKGGSIATVDFLLTHRLRLTPALFGMAALHGQLDMMKELKRRECRWDKRVCWLAAFGGQLDALKWARSQDRPCPWDYRLTVKLARERNYPEIEMYCVEHKFS